MEKDPSEMSEDEIILHLKGIAENAVGLIGEFLIAGDMDALVDFLDQMPPEMMEATLVASVSMLVRAAGENA